MRDVVHTCPIETALLAGQFFQRNSSRALVEFVGRVALYASGDVLTRMPVDRILCMRLRHAVDSGR
jgi:hypothetical protein